MTFPWAPTAPRLPDPTCGEFRSSAPPRYPTVPGDARTTSRGAHPQSGGPPRFGIDPRCHRLDEIPDSFFVMKSLFHCVAASVAVSSAISLAVPPTWWGSGTPPVVDPEGPNNSLGVANVGQAKHMLNSLLYRINQQDPLLYSPLYTALAEPRPDPSDPESTLPPIIPLEIPDPIPGGWQEKQQAPLLLGQLKAIAAPVYDLLHQEFPDWLEDELEANDTKDPVDESNYYPWTSSPADDANQSPATIGQLKAVFALHIETLDHDYDDDGLTNSQESGYGTLPRVADTDGDGDNDGTEVANGTDPTLPHPSVAFRALADSFIDGISSRIAGKSPSTTTQNVFSAADHGTQTYTRNSDLWCADLACQLTGCAAWKSNNTSEDVEAYGGIAITKRHVLFVGHQPPPFDASPPQEIRFVDIDGNPVNRHIIASTPVSLDPDISVALLDEILPESIHIIPVLPQLSDIHVRQLMELEIPDVCVSRGSWSGPVHTAPRVYIARYNGSPLSNVHFAWSSNSTWYYEPISGDSGTPRFFVTSSGLVFYRIHSGFPAGPALINQYIAACDAIALAATPTPLLTAPTGLTVTVSPIVIPDP